MVYSRLLSCGEIGAPRNSRAAGSVFVYCCRPSFAGTPAAATYFNITTRRRRVELTLIRIFKLKSVKDLSRCSTAGWGKVIASFKQCYADFHVIASDCQCWSGFRWWVVFETAVPSID